MNIKLTMLISGKYNEWANKMKNVWQIPTKMTKTRETQVSGVRRGGNIKLGKI